MGRKIKIGADLFDEHTIAFVRKLKKRLKPTEIAGGGTIPGKAYVVQLAHWYKLDGDGRVSSIFLDEAQGKFVISQLEEIERGRKSRGSGAVDGEVGSERGPAEAYVLGASRVPPGGA